MTSLSHAFGSACRSLSSVCRHKLQYQAGCNVCTHIQNQRVISSSNSILQNNGQLDFRIQQIRCMSDGRKSFIKNWFDNVKEDFSKSREMKENLKKFREDREKLEQAEALKKARQKFQNIQSEAEGLKKRVEEVKGKIAEGVEEVQKTEIVKKAGEFTSELGKTAGKAAENIAKKGQELGETAAFKTISKGVKTVGDELEQNMIKDRAKHYQAPEILRKRSDNSDLLHMQRRQEATGMVLHKSSKFYQSWQNFKDNNQYVNKLFDIKMKYDESDNVAIRGARFVTDKISSIFVSFVISRLVMHLFVVGLVDLFLLALAAIRGDLEVLKDWSHEVVATAQMMEQGPVLIIMFTAQQIYVIKDKAGLVVDGDPDKILRVTHVWALCRDPEEFNPEAAWKLLEVSSMNTEQFL
ncbi:hypothetical protein KUTeg_017778 [Tegillarca granosa]|uniref:Tim44-like domain-containing protein n=1 Tax=Tegillarca granosa TaxID=220873 RepID=A0ABQ9EKW8_TEGGR|nr:hypothetical protein KUTeg_017778 [Tegillarca granosa]